MVPLWTSLAAGNASHFVRSHWLVLFLAFSCPARPTKWQMRQRRPRSRQRNRNKWRNSWRPSTMQLSALVTLVQERTVQTGDEEAEPGAQHVASVLRTVRRGPRAQEAGAHPELMAYMATIIRASFEIEGAAWAVYDNLSGAKRRPPAIDNGCRLISRSTQSASRGKRRRPPDATGALARPTAPKTVRCHGEEEDPDVAKRLKTIEAAVMALTQSSTSQQPRNWSAEPSRKYNWTECKFRACKYAHRCISCRGNHPATHCSSHSAPQQQQQQQQPESVANATPLGPFRRAPPPTQRPPAPNTPY